MPQFDVSPDPSGRPLTDYEWLAAIRGGDESAFATLFATFYDALWALVNEYVHAPDTAEEIVQEVFLKVWEQRTTWQVHGSIRGYLYSAARSRALDYLRRERVARRWEQTTVLAAESGDAMPVPDDVEARYAAAELSAAIDEAIAHLTPALREVLVLRARHHLTYPEIARVLGVPHKTIETRVTRAFRALRGTLGRYLD